MTWFLDWSGQAVAIIASGPSTKGAGVGVLRDRLKVLAIKENAYELCPWADVAYGCDLGWWRHRRGLENFKGVKVAYDPRVRGRFPDVHLLRIQEKCDRLLLDEPGVVGSGGNSGFQAFNLAIQFGASRILLVGFDMHDRGGVHWYGRNYWYKGNNPDAHNFKRWRAAFDAAAEICNEIGVDVVNASMASDLRGFRKRTIEQALMEWNL